MQVTVIGAGVAGLACALELAERGASVEVLERGGELGAAGCSWFAGGMLAPWCERESSEPLDRALGAEGLALVARALPRHRRSTARWSWLTRAIRPSWPVCRTHRRISRARRRTIGALEPDLAGRFTGPVFPRTRGISIRVPRSRRSPARLARARGAPSASASKRRRRGAQGGPRDRLQRAGSARRLADLRGVKGEMLLLRLRRASLSAGRCGCCIRACRCTSCRARAGLFMVGATMIESDESAAHHCALDARAAVGGLRTASGVRRGPDRRDRYRRARGISRQPAAASAAWAARCTSTACTGTAFCWRRRWRAAPRTCCCTGGHFPEVMDEDTRQRRLA